MVYCNPHPYSNYYGPYVRYSDFRGVWKSTPCLPGLIIPPVLLTWSGPHWRGEFYKVPLCRLATANIMLLVRAIDRQWN